MGKNVPKTRNMQLLKQVETWKVGKIQYPYEGKQSFHQKQNLYLPTLRYKLSLRMSHTQLEIFSD